MPSSGPCIATAFKCAVSIDGHKTRWFKGIEHVPNIFMSFDKYLFLEVINILI